MNANIGCLDRQIRITSGIILIALVLTGVLGPWGWIGVVPLATGLYIAKKGHPRLRMRHKSYAISPHLRDEWMLCMTQALTEQVADVKLRHSLIVKFSEMASHLINTDGRHICVK